MSEPFCPFISSTPDRTKLKSPFGSVTLQAWKPMNPTQNNLFSTFWEILKEERSWGELCAFYSSDQSRYISEGPFL